MIDRVELSFHLGITPQDAYALVDEGIVEAFQYGTSVVVDPRCITGQLRQQVAVWRAKRSAGGVR